MYLGIVTFYDSNKNFGFISTNNFMMSDKPDFKDRWQKLYFFDNLKKSPRIGCFVVFKLSKHKGKYIATNVDKCNLTTHKNLILQYCIYSNIISVVRREKVCEKNRYGRISYHYQDVRKYYSIFDLFNISINDVLEPVLTLLEKKGYECFIKTFIRVVDTVIKADLLSCHLRSNNESISAAIKGLFEKLDINQEVSICRKYRFLTSFSSDPAQVILKEDDILLENQKEREYLQNMINKKKVFHLFYDDDDKSKIRRGELVNIPSFIRRMNKCGLSLVQYRQQIYSQMTEKTNYIIDSEIETYKYSHKSVIEFQKIYGSFADQAHENKLLYVCANKPLIDFLNLLQNHDNLLTGIESGLLKLSFEKIHYSKRNIYISVKKHFSNLYNTYLKLNDDHQKSAYDAYFDHFVLLLNKRISKIFSDENRYVRSSNELIALILDIDEILKLLPLPNNLWISQLKKTIKNKLLEIAIEAVKNQPDWWSSAYSEAIWLSIDNEHCVLLHELIVGRYDSNDLKQVNRFYQLRFIHLDEVNVQDLLINSSMDDILNYGLCFIYQKFNSSIEKIIIEKIKSSLNKDGNFLDNTFSRRSDFIENLLKKKLIEPSQFDFLSFHDKLLLNKRYVDGLITIEQAKNYMLQHGYSTLVLECNTCRKALADILCSYLEDEDTDKALDCIRTIMKIPRSNYYLYYDSSWIDYLCNRLKKLPNRNGIDFFSYGIYIDNNILFPKIPNDVFDWNSVLYIDLSYNRCNSKLDPNKLYVYIPTFFHKYLDNIKKKINSSIIDSYIDVTSFLQNNTLNISEKTIIPYIISICYNSYFDNILINKGVPASLIERYSISYSDQLFLERISDIMRLEATEKHDIFPRHGDHPTEANIHCNLKMRFTTPLSIEAAKFIACAYDGITVTTNSFYLSSSYHCDDWTTSYGFSCTPAHLIPKFIFKLTYLFRTNCCNLTSAISEQTN